MKTKICTKCEEEKELSNFNKNKNYKDGLSYWCKECISQYKKDYALKNKNYRDKNKIKCKKWYEENKEEALQQCKKYRIENKEKISKEKNKYRLKNKNKINKKLVEKTKIDINFKLAKNLRSRILKALKGIAKSKKTLKLLGCTIKELKHHLESQFTEGMSWDNHNYYGWHVDHIKPCASFDLTDPKQQEICFNYKNLQPLWAVDNIRKSDKILN